MAANEEDWNNLPPGSVTDGLTVANVTDAGDMECPGCGTFIITPMGENPHKGGKMEKYCLIPGVSMPCRVCDRKLVVTKSLAKKHNHIWFPDDPEFK